jgi:hypothetical protein
MNCPAAGCRHRGVRANPDDDMGAEWFICPNPNCVQGAWSRGERNPKRSGRAGSVVENLVSLTEEERERRVDLSVSEHLR